MADVLHADFETRAVADLVKVGADKYAADEHTDAWCMGYAFNDEPEQIWIKGEPLPERIRKHIESGGLFFAWNAAFELAIWNRVMVPRYGWPELKPEQCRCVMMMAGSMSLPLGLDKCSQALSMKIKKDMQGHRLMLRMSRPRSMDPLVWWEDTKKLQKLYAYCKQDVKTERAIVKKLRPLRKSEQNLWVRDQQINQRGVPVDLETVDWLIDWCADERKRLNKAMRKVTGGRVRDCSDVAGLAKYAGVKSVAKEALKAHIEAEEDGPVRQALVLRQDFAKTSTKKLEAFQRGTMDDGRMRGIFQFYGAESTGRWAGRRVQPQNLPRPLCKQAEIERRLEEWDFNSLQDVADCLRAMIAAPEGRVLVCADFSSIEARVLAWLSGSEKVLKAFIDGLDLYKIAAEDIYGVDYCSVNDDQRQVGKVACLALGYQGARGAFLAMAAGYGVSLPPGQVDHIVASWRDGNPDIVNYWYKLERAAERCIKSPGRAINVGRVTFVHKKGHLWCKLPSGRYLCWPRAKIGRVAKPWGSDEGIKYVGENSYTHKVEWLTTYGGKLCENIVQAVARDLLAGSMIRLERAGYPVVLHVHDEVAALVDEDFGSLEEFEEIMAMVPSWAEGLPLGAEGWRGKRYRKG
jgi:DNA polymerase